MANLRVLLASSALVLGVGSVHAAGSLTLSSSEWNGTSLVASDGFAEDAYLDTDVFQSGSTLGVFSQQLQGGWTFNLGTASILDAVVLDLTSITALGITLPSGANPLSVQATIDSSTVTASRVGSNPGSYTFDFGNTVFAAGAKTLTFAGFNALDIGPAGSPNVTVVATAVPEPESYAMMIAGLGAMGFMARRRKSSKV